MTPHEDLTLQRYLDGRLAGAELAAFNELLRTNAAAREQLREIAAQAVAMGDLVRAEALDDEASRRRTIVPKGWTWSTPFAMAASVAILAAAVWFFVGGREPGIVTITATEGSVSWSGGGETNGELKPGERLAAGTIETTGDAATAQFQFADGTRVTLTGDAELAVAAAGQKQLTLRHGALSAEVTRQPAGRPLIVRTPSAEIVVLGTSFSLDAQRDETSLNVAKGTVQLRRLADDQMVEVNENQGATATLASDAALAAKAFSKVPTRWQHAMQVPRPAKLQGREHPAQGLEPARLSAQPYAAGRRKSGKPRVFYGIAFGISPRGGRAMVQITESSVLKMRFRVEKLAKLEVFASTADLGGSFAGNFNSGSLEPSGAAGEWQEIVLPIRELRVLPPGNTISAPGLNVWRLIVHSGGADAGLEIAEIGIHES